MFKATLQYTTALTEVFLVKELVSTRELKHSSSAPISHEYSKLAGNLYQCSLFRSRGRRGLCTYCDLDILGEGLVDDDVGVEVRLFSPLSEE